jgi:hypothetical protein
MRSFSYLAAAVVLLATTAGAEASTALVPTPIGPGAAYHPGPRGPLLRTDGTIAGLACSDVSARHVGAHLELFSRGFVVLVPAGIGMAAPLRRIGLLKVSGGCSYPVRTREPTGVVETLAGSRITLGQLFAVWGQPLDPRRLAGFRAVHRERVRAWVNGRLWPGDVRSIPLRQHAEVVLELGRFVPPHVSYRFEKGL